MTSIEPGPRTEAERGAKSRALRKLYPMRDADFRAKDSIRHVKRQKQAQQDLEDFYGSDAEYFEPLYTQDGKSRGEDSSESGEESADESIVQRHKLAQEQDKHTEQLRRKYLKACSDYHRRLARFLPEYVTAFRHVHV